LYRRLGGPQSWSGQCGIETEKKERKNERKEKKRKEKKRKEKKKKKACRPSLY
jgi:hypothetical protein